MLGWTVCSAKWLASTWSMEIPPRSSAPFWREAPERMLPVWPGWMPTPVALLLNSPVTKFILCLSFSMGARLLPSSIWDPEPLADQWSALMPQPMKTAAKRLGGRLAAAAGTSPQTAVDSSHGRAIATPAPRRKVRRERAARFCLRIVGFIRSLLRHLCSGALGQELPAGHDRLDQVLEAIPVGGELRLHRGDGVLVRE